MKLGDIPPNDPDAIAVDGVLQQLTGRFDNVLILVSRFEGDGTKHMAVSHGNGFALRGHVSHWQSTQEMADQSDVADAIEASRESEEDDE